jgi:hypothetical protein
MNFSSIHLRFVKLTADVLVPLQTSEPPPQTTRTISTAITRSPEIPSPSPVGASYNYIPGSPSTPTPGQSRRPLGSPIKQSRGLQLGVVDPGLLAYRDRPMSIAESTNGGSPTREEWEEDEKELEENAEDVVGALVIKSPSEDREGSQVSEVRRRPMSDEVVYETNKRKRENYYRSTSKRIKENLRKIGTVTRCYSVLYLSRHVVLFHPSTDYAGT